MKNITLNQLIDCIDCDTEVALYIGHTKLCDSLRVYDFPARHDANEYYGNKVDYFKATESGKMDIYLLDRDQMKFNWKS